MRAFFFNFTLSEQLELQIVFVYIMPTKNLSPMACFVYEIQHIGFFHHFLGNQSWISLVTLNVCKLVLPLLNEKPFQCQDCKKGLSNRQILLLQPHHRQCQVVQLRVRLQVICNFPAKNSYSNFLNFEIFLGSESAGSSGSSSSSENEKTEKALKPAPVRRASETLNKTER